MSYWHNKRVLVTGGAGFIGSHLVEALRQKGCSDIFVVRSRQYDLTKEDDVIRMLEVARPDIVIHLAGLAGGVSANMERPAEFFYQNLTMGTFMLHHACRMGIQKFVAAGAGHYPLCSPVPQSDGCPRNVRVLREHDLWWHRVAKLHQGTVFAEVQIQWIKRLLRTELFLP